MKLSRLFAMAMMMGSLAVLGCNDDTGGGGSAGMAGDGGSGGDPGFVCDAEVICVDCPEGRERDDCEADVFACDTLDPRGCEACVEETQPGC